MCATTTKKKEKKKTGPLSFAFAQIRKMWWPLQREGWKFWPFVHIITYNFIPRDERVLWVDMVELVWIVAFISILENSNSDKSKESGGGVSD